jgi:hypothetical protein
VFYEKNVTEFKTLKITFGLKKVLVPKKKTLPIVKTVIKM